jgi:predicted PurR-regulated permease PerM
MFFVTSKILKESLNLVNTLRSGLNDDSLIPLLVKSSGFMSSITEKEFFWVGIPKLYYEFVGKYTDILNLDSIYSILRNSTSLLAGSFDIPFTILFNTLLFFLILYFLYKEGNHIENYLIRTLPFSKHLEQKIGLKLEEAIESVVLGNLFVSLLQGLFLYILLFLWGIPNSFLFATIATFFSLIPVVGTSVIWLPVMVYLGLFSSSWAFAIPFGILSFSGYLILENYIKPNFLDKKLNMHPFLIFLSLIGGINQFGVVGIVIGPVSLTFLLILLEFWRDFQNISSNE